MNDLATKAGLAVLGIVIGWSGNALTLTGRVDAIERAVQRIEQHLLHSKKEAPDAAS